MCSPLEGVGISMAKKALGAPDARKAWCDCVSEFGDMISNEVRTNPRYDIPMKFHNEPIPPST